MKDMEKDLYDLLTDVEKRTGIKITSREQEIAILAYKIGICNIITREEPIKCKKCVWWEQTDLLLGLGSCHNVKIDKDNNVSKNYCCGIGVKK